MKDRIIRLRLPEDLYTKYKVLCAQKDLSMTKLNVELIDSYVKVNRRESRKIM